MQQAEYNHNDFVNQQEADKSLMVRFFYKDVQNKMESRKQGRPIFKEKLYMEIRIAGQRDAQVCRPATHADKQRFPAHLEAFEKRMEPPTEGTPLSEWAMITRTQAEEMSFLNVKTVEQLATMKDTNTQQFMNGYKLRDQAIKWLETHNKEGEDREKEELKASVATLTEQVAQLLAASVNMPSPLLGIDELEALVPNMTLDLESTKDITETVSAPAPDLTSDLDGDGEPVSESEPKPIEGAAVPVPAAPGAVKKRAPRKSRAKV